MGVRLFLFNESKTYRSSLKLRLREGVAFSRPWLLLLLPLPVPLLLLLLLPLRFEAELPRLVLPLRLPVLLPVEPLLDLVFAIFINFKWLKIKLSHYTLKNYASSA
jgi:hypothetical protein